MISHDRKFIFIHIPKTAGTSIEKGLSPKGLFKVTDRKGVRHKTPEHWEFPNCWDSYYTFTFVRNPWDRLVSAYFCDYAKSHRSKIERRHNIKSIQEKYGDNGFQFFVRDLLPEYIGNQHFYRPQSYWFKEARYRFVGRFEKLQEDFEFVCNQISLPIIPVLPHIQKSNHVPYWKYYDKQTEQVVADIYSEDIERLGYKFRD